MPKTTTKTDPIVDSLIASLSEEEKRILLAMQHFQYVCLQPGANKFEKRLTILNLIRVHGFAMGGALMTLNKSGVLLVGEIERRMKAEG